MRNQTEIDAELKALKALRPVGVFARKTASLIRVAIETLESGFDESSDEWLELNEDQRDIVEQVRSWIAGLAPSKVSEGFGELVAR